MEIIVGKQGNQRIPITDQYVSRKHCKITTNGDGSYTIENLSQNGTFINGRKILKTKVQADTVIQLGPNYSVKVSDLLPITNSIINNKNSLPQKEFSIKPLESIWNEYHDSLLELQARQHKLGLLIRIPMLFTVVGGVLTAIISEDYRFVTLGISVLAGIIMIYGFIKSKNFVFAKEKDILDMSFQDRYICPNPECGHFLGNKPYKVLSQDKCCGYCRCRYNSK
ncbi:FHA domain-containing protein [bacterium]|nr:FHA domain-containing protein [bacterium]